MGPYLRPPQQHRQQLQRRRRNPYVLGTRSGSGIENQRKYQAEFRACQPSLAVFSLWQAAFSLWLAVFSLWLAGAPCSHCAPAAVRTRTRTCVKTSRRAPHLQGPLCKLCPLAELQFGEEPAAAGAAGAGHTGSAAEHGSRRSSSGAHAAREGSAGAAQLPRPGSFAVRLTRAGANLMLHDAAAPRRLDGDTADTLRACCARFAGVSQGVDPLLLLGSGAGEQVGAAQWKPLGCLARVPRAVPALRCAKVSSSWLSLLASQSHLSCPTHLHLLAVMSTCTLSASLPGRCDRQEEGWARWRRCARWRHPDAAGAAGLAPAAQRRSWCAGGRAAPAKRPPLLTCTCGAGPRRGIGGGISVSPAVAGMGCHSGAGETLRAGCGRAAWLWRNRAQGCVVVLLCRCMLRSSLC